MTTSADSPARVQPIPVETQAQRRRAQLIRIAAALVETEGVDASTMSRVAELAGCTRTQVHRYFARREDLLIAVVEEFHDRLQVSLSEVNDRFGNSDRPLPELAEEWSAAVHEAVWDLFEEGGLAGLILLTVPHVSSGIRRELARMPRPLFEPWIKYVERTVHSHANAKLVVELWTATAYRIAMEWRAGELSRKSAIEILTRTQLAILHGFSELPPLGTDSTDTPKTSQQRPSTAPSSGGRDRH